VTVTTSSPVPLVEDLRRLLRNVLMSRTLVARALVLALALGLSEGIGLFLILPLLSIAGVPMAGSAPPAAVAWLSTAFERLGLPQTLPAVLAVFVVMIGARSALQRAETLALAQLENGFVSRLRANLYEAIAKTRWTYFTQTKGATFTHALTTEAERAGIAVSQVFQFVLHVVLLATYTVVALQLSPVLTGCALLAALTLLLLSSRATMRVKSGGEAVSRELGALHAAAAEHMTGMKTVRSFGAEDRSAGEFRALVRQAGLSEMFLVGAQATSALQLSLAAAIAIGVFVYASLSWLQLSMSTVLLFLLVFSRMLPRATAAITAFQHVLGSLPGFLHIERLTAACQGQSDLGDHASSLPSPVFRRSIGLHGVTFGYDEGVSRHAVDGVSLDIPFGTVTAIVGASGAGKSTVADLVLGLLSPDHGRITVDGEPLLPQHWGDWRRQVGVVPQESFLLHDSIRANLLWSVPTASERDVMDALRDASAESLVERFPDGLDTIVGDRGSRLSGGERQRLALARALLRRPRLLVLDEATSSLDAENERHVLEALGRLSGRATVLLITHRLSAVRGADVIHVMEAGRVVQSGRWSALLADRSAPFYRLCMAQGVLEG